jgi:hypothetical protein
MTRRLTHLSYNIIIVVVAASLQHVNALSQHPIPKRQVRFPTRAEVLQGSIGAALGVLLLGGQSPAAVLKDSRETLPSSSSSSSSKLQLDDEELGSDSLFSPSLMTPPPYLPNKKLDLSDAQLKGIITSDIIDRQFTATANMTRSIYDRATFVDENIPYTMDQWIHGTQTLFDGANSRVRLVGEVNVSPEQADFIFDEHLQFRLPFFRPTVHLTGKVVLKRDLASGYITSYEEFWDKDVVSVLLTATF